MIGLIQRVTHANVVVADKEIAKIDQGILLLLGVEKEDTEENAKNLLDKILNFRIFEDEIGKMNLSLLDITGSLLVVPQFTLPANTQKGTRPSFASAAPPQLGNELFDYFVSIASNKVSKLQTGQFGADMKVSLCNDGPVTFWLKK
ncbi:D-aminoacyl-tRNA deacylase [Cocleimonas sp. KMM 6892]|uniref:D-aminoacyl-tRNA deacylase n=1 Tax=unclassified Cocleimonas TaxID=2639732 RepID=UPI002DC018E5|nr:MULTISPECIES: D-aminoacyl-tRNA deacylase [unclassified Cocleimonas]MEB8431535.1 D-aminoacyl-tRNA deacylase [Cocleimonas sp. KMM 6892]MEC4713693.1 D-aminoacyl-tRNA deacylase [Cocleimonas sp. KMM 6895]MEC4743024.1 D-aminoacyl-tRNA deacylase [Cocleimonas sp. KMM 6896]